MRPDTTLSKDANTDDVRLWLGETSVGKKRPSASAVDAAVALLPAGAAAEALSPTPLPGGALLSLAGGGSAVVALGKGSAPARLAKHVAPAAAGGASRRMNSPHTFS